MSAIAMPVEPERSASSWAERNQRWLSQRFSFWRAQLERDGPAEPDGLGMSFAPETRDDEDAAALRLAGIFGLSVFERELLIVAAGVEIDAGVRDAVARAQATPRGHAVRLNFATALGLLPAAHWDAVSPLGALRLWSLVDFDTSDGFLRAGVRIDERVLHYLTGVAAFDERLRGLVRHDETLSVERVDPLAADIADALEAMSRPLILLANANRDASYVRAGRLLAAAVFHHLAMGTLWVDSEFLPSDPGELRDIARRIDREAALTGSGVAISLDPNPAHAAKPIRLLAALRSPLIVLGRLSSLQLADVPGRPTLRFNVRPARTFPQGELASPLERAVERALQQFRVEPELLEQALGSIAVRGNDAAVEGELWDRLRESARGGLDPLAERVESRTRFTDLVVPPFVTVQLLEIAGQLKHRHQVYEEWGFAERNSRGLGIAALFAGESGTGKTFAAEAIANEARLDLYRIDLSSVVSKYIGETEKNLARLFEAAETSGAVLLFDEADALFGKRSEVKDSHDRYANIEVAYLLQRIEGYRGLAILTSNMKGGLDRSFLRRLRHVVQFPFPDEPAREEIWVRQFPPSAPVRELDFAELARLQLPGGNIRAVAMNAAFKAAEAGRPIDQALVLEAARAEFARLERTMSGPLRNSKA